MIRPQDLRTTARTCALALLLAGSGAASPIALAASSTFYGMADLGYGNTQYRYRQGPDDVSAHFSGVKSNMHRSSRWGFRGTEDLGGGLHAIFNLEGKIDMSNGATDDFRRRSIVGLSSKSWGTVTAGRQENVADKLLKLTTVRGLGKASRAFGNHDDVRVNALLRYLSPVVHGFQGGLGYAHGLGTRDDFRSWVTTGVVYARGPVRVAAALDRQEPVDKMGLSKGYRVLDWTLATSYDLKLLKLNLGYGRDRNGKFEKPGGVSSKTLDGFSPPGLGDYNQPGFRSNNYFLGTTIPLGPGTLGLSWTRSSSNLEQVYAALHPGQQIVAAVQQIYAGQYLYPLSRRSLLFFYGAYGKGLAYLAGYTGRELGIGLNHVF